MFGFIVIGSLILYLLIKSKSPEQNTPSNHKQKNDKVSLRNPLWVERCLYRVESKGVFLFLTPYSVSKDSIGAIPSPSLVNASQVCPCFTGQIVLPKDTTGDQKSTKIEYITSE
jgi:hypothetical protein